MAWAQADVLGMGCFDGGEHLFSVSLGLYFGKDSQQFLIRSDEECSSFDPHHFLAIHILFLENIKLFANYFVYICKEGIGQVVFLFEFLLRLGRVARYTQNDGSGVLYLLEDVAKAACLDRAAGSVGLGIKEKHHRFAGEILQMHRLVFFGLKREVGNFVVQFHEKDPSKKRDERPQRDYSTMRNSKTRALILCLALAVPACAQYPGRMETTKKAAPTMRSIAVLEWTGQTGKPSASRIIPISVFDGEQYQPGGLYLAKPEPLALEPGTEYVLQDAGVARGLFDVNTAQDVEGYWFGYGAWKPMAAPPKRIRPKQGRNMPQVVTDANDGRPHLNRRDSSGSQDSPASSGSGSSSPNTQSSNNPPAGDPDRPTLRRRSDSPSAASPSASASVDTAAPETAIGGADPDRPRMMHGQQTPTDKDFQPAQLTGVPSGLQQMIAVSDAGEREAHPFVYLWSDPADATKMQAQMEIAAGDAVTASEPAVKPPLKSRTVAASAQRRKATTKATASPKFVFTNERFKAYELTYSGGGDIGLFRADDRPGGQGQICHPYRSAGFQRRAQGAVQVGD